MRCVSEACSSLKHHEIHTDVLYIGKTAEKDECAKKK